MLEHGKQRLVVEQVPEVSESELVALLQEPAELQVARKSF
jgi:hypothetical protein